MKLSVLCLGVKNCYVTINLLLHNKCITKRLKCLLELGETWFSPQTVDMSLYDVCFQCILVTVTRVNNLLRLVKVLLFRFTFHIIKAHFEYREIKWEELKKKTKQKNKTKTKKKSNPKRKRKIFSFSWKHKRQLSIIGGGRDGDDSGHRIPFSMNCNNKAKIKTQVFFSVLLLQFVGLC